MNEMRKLIEASAQLFDDRGQTYNTDDPHRHFSKNDLIQKVIQQILDDVGNNDFTAIAELLEFIPDDKLAGFLPDY